MPVADARREAPRGSIRWRYLAVVLAGGCVIASPSFDETSALSTSTATEGDESTSTSPATTTAGPSSSTTSAAATASSTSAETTTAGSTSGGEDPFDYPVESCRELRDYFTGEMVEPSSGIYSIRLPQTQEQIRVYCDMEELDGGWMLAGRSHPRKPDSNFGWRSETGSVDDDSAP